MVRIHQGAFNKASVDSKQHSNAIGAIGLQARILGIDGRLN